MADISDVMDAISASASAAIGSSPTITGRQIDVGQGWPLAEDIDKAMAAGASMVSVYLVAGAGGRPSQIFDWDPQVVAPAAKGLTLSVVDTTIAISGTSAAQETVVVAVNDTKLYSHTSTAPETAVFVAAALLAQVQADFPAASVFGSSLFIPSYRLTARNGGVATMLQKIHRQSAQLRVVVWSPNPEDRTTIARAIDVSIKDQLRFPMPDTTDAIVSYEGTNFSDKEENAGIYRRDLLLSALFDTTLTYQASEILGVVPSYG